MEANAYKNRLLGQAVSEEKTFEIVDGQRTDVRPWVSYKLTGEPSAQVN